MSWPTTRSATRAKQSRSTIPAVPLPFTITLTLGNRYPDALVQLFEDNREKIEHPGVFIDALAASNVSRKSKARLILSEVKSKNFLYRQFVLRHILRMKNFEAVPLLVKELDGIPKTSHETIFDDSVARRVSELVCLTDDERAWNALLTNAKRVDICQRTKMIQAVGRHSCRNASGELVIQFLSAFLEDKGVQVFKNRCDHFIKRTDRQKEVRDFAAHQIANKLDLDVAALTKSPDTYPSWGKPWFDASWKAEDWARLRKAINEALAKRNAKSTDKGKDE